MRISDWSSDVCSSDLERLAEYFADPQILRRSAYYNEWMRPQRLDHTMGASFEADAGMILNLSLLRSAREGPFCADEFRRFAGIARPLDSELRLAARLEQLTTGRSAACDALHQLPHATAFVLPCSRYSRCQH